MKLLPKKLLENFQHHHQLSLNKVHRRLNLEQQRHEIETPMIEPNTDMQQTSFPDIESTFYRLMLAGSETTATTHRKSQIVSSRPLV